MHARIKSNQLDHLISLFKKKGYSVYGPKKRDGNIFLEEISAISEIQVPTPKTILPFKKVLYKDGRSYKNELKKIVFFGLTNCDACALKIFLEEFKKTDILPEQDQIFTVITECKRDEFCFCSAFGLDQIENCDLYLQKTGEEFEIFAQSETGKKILKDAGIKAGKEKLSIRPIASDAPKLDAQNIKESIEDKKDNEEFWTRIANNCFGCGACTAVCPLCFCTKQDFQNDLAGECRTCLKWDSCFAKSFSEIQNHFDFRPTNKDRIYNWYHHKFVRAVEQNDHVLCTGCGRCIKACPAHLNQHAIMQALEKQEK